MLRQIKRSLIKFTNQIEKARLPFFREHRISVPYISSQPGDCGAACVAMVIEKYTNKSAFFEIVTKYKTPENYIESVGWKHFGLVNILHNYGISSKYYKNLSIVKLVNEISNNRPVIVSLRVPEIDNLSDKLYSSIVKTIKPTGHLVVVTGMQSNDIILHDPRNIGVYIDNLKVPVSTFANIYMRRGIVVNG